MSPQRVDHRGGKGLVVIHRCTGCGFTRANRIAADCAQSDDLDAVIALLADPPAG